MYDEEYRPVPLDYSRPDPDGALRASRDFLATMSRRRTVREFSSEAVPFELVSNAVATAATAPSGAHQQPWTFVVVSDPEVKTRMRVAAEEEERRSYDGRLGEEWLRALRRLGTDWRKPHITDAPYGLATLTHTPSPMGFLTRLLGRPRNERPALLVPVGYPAPDATVPDLERRRLDEVLVRV